MFKVEIKSFFNRFSPRHIVGLLLLKFLSYLFSSSKINLFKTALLSFSKMITLLTQQSFSRFKSVTEMEVVMKLCSHLH